METHASPSHEASLEPKSKRREDLCEHSVFLIFPKTEIARSARGQKLPGPRAGGRNGGAVKTTPQMTRFRDAKVCNNLVTDEIDDHRIQSDDKCTIGLQYKIQKERTLHMVLRSAR